MKGWVRRRRGIANKYLAILAIVLFGTAGIAGYALSKMPSTGTTSSTTESSTTTTSVTSSTCASAPPAVNEQLTSVTFGAVTEFNLSANRTPAGFAVAPDGSVWVGEWGLPGVAHIFPNGTLTEYKWPYPLTSPISLCGQETQIWGVALWNGTVWAADNIYSRLVSVNPTTGQTEAVNLTTGVFPYTLSVGDGDLWFTDNLAPGTIGKLTPDSLTPVYYTLPDPQNQLSQYIIFQNSTRAYVLTADPSDFIAGLYAFNPAAAVPTFTSVGSNQTLYEPSGLALGNGGIWATEHAASAMAFLNFTTNHWTIYPTSTVPYVPDVLTYFDGSNGTVVWFNEHYSNRMGVITGDGRYLSEYSITDPPLFNITTILENYNMVTMGLATDEAWFAAATANIVGFVNGSYVPPFSISAGATTVQVAPGSSTQIGLQEVAKPEEGQTLQSLNISLQFEDNEFYNGSAKLLTFTPAELTATVSAAGVATTNVSVTISAASNIAPGDYVAAATLTNGGSIYRTVYFTVIVT